MICHVTVHTARLGETVAFYQWLLGLSVANTLHTPAGKIVFLGEEETKFELIEDKQAEGVQAKGITVGFAVGDLDEKLALLDGKGIAHSPVISPSAGTRFAYFTDLNGCGIQLFERK
ncbi:MAG: VOC family protein [Oscillospiraceae bacterium]|nr:VOC family protein [Oscillospiraceae bacterium]